MVQTSRFGNLGGVPWPLVGIVGFAALFAVALCRGRRAHLALGVLSGVAGLTGLALIGLQLFVIGDVCVYCLTVDALAVVAAASHLLWNRLGPAPAADPSRRWWLVGAAVVLAVPLVWGLLLPAAPVPPEVAALWEPGRINVVEVADFQCPHCRETHRNLQTALRGQGDRVHLVLLSVPMPSHPDARAAVRAHRCAAAKGKGRQMAEALFAAEDLSPAACLRLAAGLGLSPGAFRACRDDPALDRRVDADIAWVRQASPHGLPAVWIQEQLLSGEQSAQALREALSRAQPARPAVAASASGD